MSSSLPVPSKAALTALRGLLVGTSCTLAVLAEDRRRKINNAVRAIENGERIKSARGYRAGAAALAVAMEEDAMWDSRFGPVPDFGLEMHQHDHIGKGSGEGGSRLSRWWDGENRAGAPAKPTKTASVGGQRAVALGQNNSSNPTTTGLNTQPGQLANPPRRGQIQPLPKLTGPLKSAPSWAAMSTETIKSYVFPSNDDIVVQIHEACNTKDSVQIGAALRILLEAMDHKLAPGNLNRPWIEATARLCRTCQEEGRLDDAARLLDRIISRGPLQESDYVDHEPFALIESFLARAELNQQAQDACVADIDTALNLFVPKFVERPRGANHRVYTLGRTLLDLCFSKKRLQRVFGVYWRCILSADGSENDLASWFLHNLYENGDYASVVKFFIKTFSQSSPTKSSLNAVGDIVVGSVERAHGHRPEEVLDTLQSVCASFEDTRLYPDWVARLLLSHWKKHRNFEEIEAMFKKLQTPRLRDSVFRSRNLYRVMVELAFEAGQEAKADSYFALAISQHRALASDVKLLGVVARFHAADGDWEAVRADFEAMKQNRNANRQVYGQVFVSVLKSYAETHTVRETEAFLRFYIDELKVPLTSFMVTVMAKQYAAIRDVNSLIAWLDYCSQADFRVDAAFTNAILARCRRQWNFPFRDLRTLFRKLQALNPDCVDKHTEHIMADAALSDSKYGGKAARGRLLSLHIELPTPPSRSKYVQAEDIIFAMKMALRSGAPRRATQIYQRAVHSNMPFSPHALQLAVQAHLTWAPADFSGAYTLLRRAQAKGEDITQTINYLLAKQLTSITSRAAGPERANALIQETLTHYHQANIRITETSLHRAASLCLAAGHPAGAIHYALSAASERGGPPCFNLQNFKLLLAAYADLLDADALRDTISRGLGSFYREDGACRTALRQARARVGRSQAAGSSSSGSEASSLEERKMRARAVVDEGIRRVVEARRELREEGKLLEAEAVRIMRRAALDAGREEVDFAEVPWLGGRKKMEGAPAPADGGGGGHGHGERGRVEGVEDGVDDFYGDLERILLEAPPQTAVEAF
ncbi:hypothetical protein F5144DRAFT_572050 [Chaetomium tenue]|uniref:Uncharacterized protein n=1 Tax=Chaetomium tenue TaxID=1854479 RepID=A0ACB7P6V5_9PEZI|nr:hypothetical protein F5144DRAFT_572050 [Chaetomium globosum]